MKIIFVTSALHGGGAERVMTTLANCFAATGDQVCILMTAGREQAYSLNPLVQVEILGEASGGNPLVRMKRLIRMRQYFRNQNKMSRAENGETPVIVSFSTTINLFTILATL